VSVDEGDQKRGKGTGEGEDGRDQGGELTCVEFRNRSMPKSTFGMMLPLFR
jgi:hypothetical protein